MKVLIIGDIIIDKYIYGTSKRLSPEAPVPVVTQERIIETQGGAGLVYENLENYKEECENDSIITILKALKQEYCAMDITLHA